MENIDVSIRLKINADIKSMIKFSTWNNIIVILELVARAGTCESLIYVMLYIGRYVSAAGSYKRYECIVF